MKNRIVVLLGFLIFLLASCAFNRPLSIDAGSYVLSRDIRPREGAAPPMVERIQVNRETKEITVNLRKGFPLVIPFSTRPKSEWPAGCPGNLYSQNMEVFDLKVNEDSQGIPGMVNPILVRNCPADPYQLVIREQGKIGGASTACSYPESCLIFQPDSEDEDQGCQDLELLVEELDREQSLLENWIDQLVDGYGPGIWYFSKADYPLFHHPLDNATLESVVGELNQMLEADHNPTIIVKSQTERMVRVEVSDDLQLTQGMGSSGAQAYLQVVLYSLTSLPGIHCVDFEFQEGDHARPDIVCRE
jgi:hypothetical protein